MKKLILIPCLILMPFIIYAQNYNIVVDTRFKGRSFDELLRQSQPYSAVTRRNKEPKANIGKALSLMKQEFPKLRYIKSDSKGDEYEDGYPEDGIATFFYFKNGYVIEECMICQSTDNFPIQWYNSLVKTFNNNYSSSLVTNTSNHKQYSFSNFNVNLIFVSEQGQNTALITYEIKKNTQSIQKTMQQPFVSKSQIMTEKKIEWNEIEYTENRNNILGMQIVGSFSAKSSTFTSDSNNYNDAFSSALQKIQKKAAKKGVRKLLITYKSDITNKKSKMKVEALGFK